MTTAIWAAAQRCAPCATLRVRNSYKEFSTWWTAFGRCISPLVGGDPLVRHQELELLLPQLISRGIHVQVVTSAFRPLAPSWVSMEHLNVVVSIDGLQPEHDIRRAPATYERILKNITGQRVTIHCTVTGQMMKRPGYLSDFLEFWTPRPEIRKIWFSLFTPQRGDQSRGNAAAGGTGQGHRGDADATETVPQA